MRTPSSLLVALLVAMALPVAAHETPWQKSHPRRKEVNKRLNTQNQRIRQGVESGKLTPQQARQLHQKDHQVRQEERGMAKQNGGHLTKQEQRALNRQENRNSRQIRREKH
jgi:uncharacterized protein HemX